MLAPSSAGRHAWIGRDPIRRLRQPSEQAEDSGNPENLTCMTTPQDLFTADETLQMQMVNPNQRLTDNTFIKGHRPCTHCHGTKSSAAGPCPRPPVTPCRPFGGHCNRNGASQIHSRVKMISARQPAVRLSTCSFCCFGDHSISDGAALMLMILHAYSRSLFFAISAYIRP
jgi:hypothetical protein